MSPRRVILITACLAAAALAASLASTAPPVSPSAYAGLQWRCIGPFRAGRTVGAAGVPSQPGVFYIGVNNGGVWKTTDYGHTWQPIFDDQPTGSIGNLAVSASNPNVIYVGSGEGLQRPDLSTGNGMYRSSDGGKTWKHLGLSDAQQIGAIIIDPQNPDRVFVAALGHPYGPNEERGVFRSTNGGLTWDKVLYKDKDTGAIALAFDPSNSQTIYADLWAARQGPWENGAWEGQTSGVFKSTDGGTTWKQLTRGLPANPGRVGFDVHRANPKIIYATIGGTGIFRSDDAGESWRQVGTDNRVTGRGTDFAEVRVDPKNPEVVYCCNTAMYKSTDGARTFTCIRGAPGGDDYHTIWIHPDHPEIILSAVDQGAIITVNGGQTWSSWYNQPTAQFYHVSTDNQFPYWVYGGQQESGSIGTSSRGRDGHITFRDWHTVGVEEYGYCAVDPLDHNIVYGGKVTRFDNRTGQVQNVSPPPTPGLAYRTVRTAPVLFAPTDPHTLYYAANVLFKTTTGGYTWEVISPDLTRPNPLPPAGSGWDPPGRRGVIYTIAPSYKDGNVIWCGTDDGLIQLTRDGGQHWADVTPPGVTAWSKVSIIDAGRHDAATAYAAINRIRCDDQKPHIYRTHDFGKTWKEIVNGLPDDPVNAVREDPVKPGLLYAATERMVQVSLNDGDDWTGLRQNMPCSSIRDLVVKDDDLVVGTHGRSFWILDDVTPLRQVSTQVVAEPFHLYKPQLAYRVRWNVNTDTPVPPEEPAGQNPPDGAIIYYNLAAKATGPVVLEILDPKGKHVRSYSSDRTPQPLNPRSLSVMSEWQRPPQALSADAGAHRFLWDVCYDPLEGGGGGRGGLSMAAIWHDTPAGAKGPWVPPGDYFVKLTVNGQSQTQPITVKMDPRVPTSREGLEQQSVLTMKCYNGVLDARKATADIQKLRTQIQTVRRQANGAVAEALAALDAKAAALVGAAAAGGGGRRGGGGGRRGGGAPVQGPPTFANTSASLSSFIGALQASDMPPTWATVSGVVNARTAFDGVMGHWNDIKGKDVPALNEQLKAAGLPVLNLE